MSVFDIGQFLAGEVLVEGHPGVFLWSDLASPGTLNGHFADAESARRVLVLLRDEVDLGEVRPDVVLPRRSVRQLAIVVLCVSEHRFSDLLVGDTTGDHRHDSVLQHVAAAHEADHAQRDHAQAQYAEDDEHDDQHLVAAGRLARGRRVLHHC